MKICSLASGSAGNATFIASKTTRILVDCGLSTKQLVARLAEIGEKPEKLDAILITHEHLDHIGGLARLMRHCIKRGRAVPVYLNPLMVESKKVDWDGIEDPPVRLFKAGASWSIGDIGVSSFTIPHDCVDPLSFLFESGGAKLGLAVDLGFIPDALRIRFRDVDALMIESNHDLDMLMNGPHPLPVKLRVAGRYGHLSNNDVAEYLRADLSPKARHLILSHLSSENNTPELVTAVAQEALDRRGLSTRLTLALQDQRTELVEL